MIKKTTILIPTCGINFEMGLKQCIESLLLRTSILERNGIKLLVVANGASEETLQYLQSVKDKKWHFEFLIYEKPIGYIGAINAGIEYQLKKDKPDYFLFLNDDTKVTDHSWLPLLLSPFEKDTKLGIVGALSLPCPVTGIDFPLGFCELVKTELLEKLNGLNKELGIGYGDDTVLAIEAIRLGYTTFSYINGWNRKTKQREGNFPIIHQGENTMHSGKFFSRDDWNVQTAKNRNWLAKTYQPLVHVIIPTYKRYGKLKKAIESIKKQNYTNIKIHVVADGDDLEVQHIVGQYRAEYSYSEHEGVCGGLPRKSVLDLLESKENEYVMFVDSDNELKENAILNLWQAIFLREQEYGIAFGKVFHTEENKELPEPEFKDKFTWGHIDSLNFMVRLDIAKLHSDKWINDPKKPITHDFDFIDTCSKDTKSIFVDAVIGSHGQKQSILLLTVTYNEEKILPHFLKHYTEFVDKILVYDGGSTDATLEILKANPLVEIISIPNEYMENIQLMNFRNTGWKDYKYDYDWVIVVDADEFLYYPNILNKLEEFRRQRITIPRIMGFQMVSDFLPTETNEPLFNRIKSGFADPEHLNKLAIFNPLKVNIQYEMGCHKANPKGDVRFSNEPLKLLHFKYVDYESFIKKNVSAAQRLSEEDKSNHWAFHYARDAKMTKEEFMKMINDSDNVIDDTTINPLTGRADLKAQHDSTFYEIVETNQYKVKKSDIAGKNILDIGANNGIFTLLADGYSANKIIAVESNPEAFKLLISNINTKGILAINKAASAKSGDKVKVGRMAEYCAHDGRCFITNDPSGNIETISLNELVTIFNDDKEIVLKMDCEGSEYDILYGADIESLRKCKTILIEMHENILHLEGKIGMINRLRSYLKSIGYQETWKHNYIDNRVLILRYDLANELDNQVTVVISTFIKPELLEKQIEAVQAQSLKPESIIVWQTKPKEFPPATLPANVRYDNVHFVGTNHDFNLPARFAMTMLAKTPYICLLDDDVLPAKDWLKESYKLSKIHNAVISPYGIDYKNGVYNDMHSNRYGDHGIHTPLPQEVDVGGHAWFGRKEWFNLFFKEEPINEKIADDIHFAYILQKYSDVKIMVSPYPEFNKEIWGNSDVNSGMGFRALHTRKWEDENIWNDPNKISWEPKDIGYLQENLNQFTLEREKIVKQYVDKVWDVGKIKSLYNESNKKIEITVDISTKNRYFTTLPLTILAVLNQTVLPKKIFIVDDSDERKDLRHIPIYQQLFTLIQKKGITWEVIFGNRNGQHHNHQIVLEKAETEWVYRCFMAREKVETINGSKYIKDIKIDDLVKTHKGHFKKVKKIFKTYYKERNPLLWINTKNSIIKCTPEHPFLVEKNKKIIWLKSSDLNVDDYLLYPYKEKDDYLNFDCYGQKNKNEYIGNLKIDNDLARFFGLYLAEGCGGWDSIRFTFNNNETEYINFIKDVCKTKFNRLPTIHKRWATTVKLNITSLNPKFIEWFGKNATNKKIPEFVFDWNLKNKLSFLLGYLQGDGWKNANMYLFTTSSKILYNNLKKLFISCGLDCTDMYIRKETNSYINERLTHSNESYEGRISTSSSKKLSDLIKSEYNDNYIKIPITKITNKKMPCLGKENQYVYNLEVEDDNSYIVGPSIVHNCDDDAMPEYNVLENLIKQIRPDVGAIGGLILDPILYKDAPAGYFNNNRLSEIAIKENTQWFKQPTGNIIEVEHLYSSFIYRKVTDIGYCLELSPAAHREETLFSYEYVRKGWKALVTTDCITWHMRNPEGGIRSHADPKFWEQDEQIFQRKLASWKVNLGDKKLITVDSGIGDTICFLEIMPDLMKKYKKLIIGTYYAALFKDYPIEVVHTFQARDILGDKLAETQNVYKYMWEQTDKGRKINLIQGYKELFLNEGKPS